MQINMEDVTEIFLRTLNNITIQLVAIFPKLLGALVILILGYLFAKLISIIIGKILKSLKFDILTQKLNINLFLEKMKVKLLPSDILRKFVFYFIMLIVLITASEVLGTETITHEINKLLALLPRVLFALLFVAIGAYIATTIKNVIIGAGNSLGISAGKVLGNIIYYFMLIMIILSALEQIGIDISIIKANLMIFISAIVVAGAISYGLASREVLSNILATFYSKNEYQKGMVIEIEDMKGRIIDSHKLGVTLQLEDGVKINIPSKKLISENVKIYDSL